MSVLFFAKRKQIVKQLDSAQVNNAGIGGSIVDGDALKAAVASGAMVSFLHNFYQ